MDAARGSVSQGWLTEPLDNPRFGRRPHPKPNGKGAFNATG